MKQRDLIKKLKMNGYYIAREDGDHMIFKADGKRSIQVPKHREINENTARQILKDAGLK